jgi:hypothetical protein
MAGEVSIPVDYGVYRSSGSSPIVNFIQMRNHRLFVRNGYIDTPGTITAQAVNKPTDIVRRNFISLVSRVDPAVVQGGLLEDGRDGVGDGVAYDTQSGRQS